MVSAVSISVVVIVKFALNSVFVIVPEAVAFVAAGNVITIVSSTEYTASASSGSLATADEIGDAAYTFEMPIEPNRIAESTAITKKIFLTILLRIYLI